jgi:hypothetical protein
LLYLHGLLRMLWPLVFERELSPGYVAAAVEGEGPQHQDELDRLVAQVAQAMEQGVRVRSTDEWLQTSMAPDLALARIMHRVMQTMVDALIRESSVAWEETQRFLLDLQGRREYRLTNAASGLVHKTCMTELGRVTQSDAPWALFTHHVGRSGMSAFQGFRIAARFAGSVHLRFETRRKSKALEVFGLLREALPDTATEEEKEEILHERREAFAGEERSCTFGAFARDLKRRFSTVAALATLPFRLVLLTLCWLCSTSILRLEVGHANNRRNLYAGGRQQKPASVSRASALQIFRNLRCRFIVWAKLLGAPLHDPKEAGPQPPAPKPKTSRGGNWAFDLFLSERTFVTGKTYGEHAEEVIISSATVSESVS